MFRDLTPKPRGESKSAGPAKFKVVTLIDKKKAQGIEIVVRANKIPNEACIAAIRNMDEQVIKPEQVNSLLQLFPSRRDIELLHAYQGEDTVLSVADRFVKELLLVPRVEQRMHCFMFKSELPTCLGDISANMHSIELATAQVQGSKKLSIVLSIALKMGNVLNQGTRSGSAVGIRLASLHQLKDTKSADNKTNLLRYMAAVLAKKYGHDWIATFCDDFASVPAAAHISVNDITSDFRSIDGGIDMCDEEIKQCDAQQEDLKTPFSQKLGAFIAESSRAVVKAKQDLRSMALRFTSLCIYLGEDTCTSPAEVFSTLRDFNLMLVSANTENQLAVRQAELREKWQAAKTAAAQKLAARIQVLQQWSLVICRDASCTEERWAVDLSPSRAQSAEPELDLLSQIRVRPIRMRRSEVLFCILVVSCLLSHLLPCSRRTDTC